MDIEIKARLYNQCVAFAQKRIDSIQHAIDSANESQVNETKSSAGDKHETGRAMLQLEQENNAAQLQDAIKLLDTILRINPDVASEKVVLGSLVITNKGKFYISISVGRIELDDETYFAISSVSPIGKLLMDSKKGSSFELNAQKYIVESVC